MRLLQLWENGQLVAEIPATGITDDAADRIHRMLWENGWFDNNQSLQVVNQRCASKPSDFQSSVSSSFSPRGTLYPE